MLPPVAVSSVAVVTSIFAYFVQGASLETLTKFLELQLLKELPKCTNLVRITNFPFSFTTPSWETYFDRSATQDMALETYFYTSLPNNSTTALSKWNHPAPTLHHRPCSILFFDISAPVRHGDNMTLNFNNWGPVPYAGSLHDSFHFFMVNVTTENPHQEDLLLEFSKTTKTLQNGFFGLSQSNGALDIYGRTAYADRLKFIFSCRGPDSWVHLPLPLLVTKMDFQGGPMLSTVCPICDKPFERFKESGKWDDHLAAMMHTLAMSVNATLEIATVFGVPKTGVTLEGDWDDFVLPLIEGTAVLTQLMEQTVENRKVVFSSSITFFDNVAFITDRPKRLRFTALSSLAKPLRLNVWIGIAISFSCMLVALEVIIKLRNSLKCRREARRSFRKATPFLTPSEKSEVSARIPSHHCHWTAFALVTSALDQCAVGGQFAHNVQGSSSRLLIALWYIMWIVVGCAFKSDLTSMIVKPAYIQPPKTFTELVEGDYKIGALFYSGSLEENFLALNNSMSRAITARVYE